MLNTISKSKAGTLKSTIKPYHLFNVRGENFVFDTTGCRFYRINELTSDFLLLCLAHSVEEAKKILLQTDKYLPENVHATAREISQVGRNGLFLSPSNYISLREAQKGYLEYELSGTVQEIELLLAENCNLACKYCYCAVSRDLPAKGLMPERIAHKAIDFLMKQKTAKKVLTLFGGEPLLNKPVIDFIMKYSQQQAKFHKKQINYIITTNATLLDDKIIDYITNYNFGLMVSLDGPKELHDTQCPTQCGEGSFDIAVANIKKLMKRRPVGVRATMTHPIKSLNDLISFFSTLGFANMTIACATNRLEAPSSVDFTKQDLEEREKQEELLLPWMLEYLKKGTRPPYFPYMRFLEKIANGNFFPKTMLFNCSAGHSKVTVDTEGKLFPCAKFCGMKNWQIGTLDQGIDEKKVKKLWANFIKCIQPQCGRCWAYAICGGPCIWDCSNGDGTFRFNNFSCLTRKNAIKRAAYIHFNLQESREKYKGTADINDLQC